MAGVLAFAAALCKAATGMVGAAAKKLAGGPAVGLLYWEPSTLCDRAEPNRAKEAARTEDLIAMLVRGMRI